MAGLGLIIFEITFIDVSFPPSYLPWRFPTLLSSLQAFLSPVVMLRYVNESPFLLMWWRLLHWFCWWAWACLKSFTGGSGTSGYFELNVRASYFYTWDWEIRNTYYGSPLCSFRMKIENNTSLSLAQPCQRIPLPLMVRVMLETESAALIPI